MIKGFFIPYGRETVDWLSKPIALTVLIQILNVCKSRKTARKVKVAQLQTCCCGIDIHSQIPILEAAGYIQFDSARDEIELISPYPLFMETESHRDIVDYAAIKEMFNSAMLGKKIPCIKSLSSSRRRMISARIREHGIESVFFVIKNAAGSNYLNGVNPYGFVADFDWLFNPSNFVKTLENKYINRTQNATSTFEDRATAQRHQRESEFRKYIFDKLSANIGDSSESY